MSFLGKLFPFLENKGLAKRVIKVMIIDPAKGIVTEYWDYEENKELADEWVGKDGVLYMMCVYKEGQPEYYATNKNMFISVKKKLNM